MKIDFIFPWVNPSDEEWQKSYSETFGKTTFEPERFRENGTLRFVFRSLEQNAPWINQVFLIVSSKTQIPSWLDTTKVRVITHDQFIPKKYLPVFNSSAIESFLPLINGISECFIYSNDDFFLNTPTQPSDFFTEEGLPKIKFSLKYEIDSAFCQICKHSFELVEKDFGIVNNCFIKPFHGPTPMRLSTLKKVWQLHNEEIIKTISKKRNLASDLNQYMYTDYQILSSQFKIADISSKYIQTDVNIQDIVSAIKEETKLFCLNDVVGNHKEKWPAILGTFIKKFPQKSKFEK